MGSHLYTDYIFLNEIGYVVLFVLSILRKKHLIRRKQHKPTSQYLQFAPCALRITHGNKMFIWFQL